ncbi:hypothetical protein BC938DRAFT_473538 [Jimgerdemannia flammicorona]|uniref:Uncharacterized protein n=1 Tax=Jimgerdemannia flammicorona TaxID=994334 RepID=A0A433Q3W6_9FUNG|nr:hypothetical protein BC938DRAFT_473538 [Jimgerdemannia flammicorona]
MTSPRANQIKTRQMVVVSETTMRRREVAAPMMGTTIQKYPGTRNIRAGETEDKDTNVDEEEGEEGTDGGHVAEDVDRKEGSEDGSDDAGDDGGDVGCPEARVELAEDRGQEAVLCHRVEDARLTEEENEHDGGETRESAEGDDDQQPFLPSDGDGDGNGGLDIEVLVWGDTSQDEGDNDVEDGTDEEGADDANGEVARRVLGLKGGGGDGIEADVGEENLLGGGEDAGNAEVVPVTIGGGGNKGLPVGGIDKPGGAEDEDDDDNKFEHDNYIVEHGRLANADCQEDRQQDHYHEAGNVEVARLVDSEGLCRLVPAQG